MNIGIVSPISLERNSLKQLLLGLAHQVFVIDTTKKIDADIYNQIDVLVISDLVLLQENKDKPALDILSHASNKAVPAVVIIDQTAPDLESIVNKIGAEDFITRPLNRFILDARLKIVHNRQIKNRLCEAQHRKDRVWMETIRKASELVTQTRTLENSFAEVAHHLQQVVPLDQFVISLDDESDVHYDVVELNGTSDETRHFTVHLCKDMACAQRQACVEGQKIVCGTVKDQDKKLAKGMKSCICIGLFDGKRRLGALSLASHEDNAFDESQLPHLESLAQQVAHTVTNIRRYQQACSETERLTVIIREVHHRIKNNLQGVIGLFGRYREDQPELTPVLNGAISQLYAIAEVHNLLSHHVQETVDWHALIQGICQVSSNLSAHKVDYSLDPNTANLTVSASEAVPMALVLNELVQNAINHGYPDGRTGTIRISAEILEQNQGVRLAVANDGEAPPQTINNITHGGFGNGLRLVHSLLPSETDFSLQRQQDWTVAEAIYPANILQDNKLEESA